MGEQNGARRATALSHILSLRLAVAFLGEKAQFGWWGSSFFEPAARAFLEPVFPRTSHLTQYHGVVEAARLVHDEHLSRGAYHLFRLREETEEDLHDLMRAADAANAPGDRETALALLEKLAGAIGHTAEGPVLVGEISQFPSKAITAAMAATYVSAFAEGRRSYPYLNEGT